MSIRLSTLALALLLSGCELMLTLQTCCQFKDGPHMCYCAEER